ncbi:MAG: DUF99 family protein [Methanothrix sp.]|jgi:hypothetical protein|uniref:UPF0215 protein XD72_1043 n=1 Tax=Methanothrix harundinacea TaxID=301375 RepID=A0A124FMF1_9EURY|nr:MAG: hypothetical protein XD72_1043 [Methanothrix harundinacea]MDD3710459.1 DUF99 family protein [Methanothrix sp.]MDI9398484.1 DUF99 family protein [Euryarchaeota archaeon]KUK95561.1 MAG: hypothetical protein XE07_1759 [Methanothrix harundinacea]MCP1391422.1 DUF99 family protein [Methanothrix harundinacea]
MTLHVNKKGVRVLGIAESFLKMRPSSRLAGVVMRKDLRVDGFGFAKISVGGDDATEGILKIFWGLERSDINALLLNGSIISWFNIVDLDRVSAETGLPVISLTYEESEGLERYIEEYFPRPQGKIEMYKKLGPREPLQLKNGFVVYARFLGATAEATRGLLNSFTLEGKVPEPLRVARLLARSTSKEEIDGEPY